MYLGCFLLRISIITVTSVCLFFFILWKILDMDLGRGPFSPWLVITHNHSFKGCSFKCWSNEWFWNFQRHLDFSLVLVLLSCGNEHGHFTGISSFFFPLSSSFLYVTFHNCIVIIFEFFLCTGYLKLI